MPSINIHFLFNYSNCIFPEQLASTVARDLVGVRLSTGAKKSWPKGMDHVQSTGSPTLYSGAARANAGPKITKIRG